MIYTCDSKMSNHIKTQTMPLVLLTFKPPLSLHCSLSLTISHSGPWEL